MTPLPSPAPPPSPGPPPSRLLGTDSALGRIPGQRSAPDPGAALRRTARSVLLRNWTGASTVPSRSLYPHQWSWDSAFVAIGLRHLSALRAQRELETLFTAQWGDGRVPHIVFNRAVPLDAYFPSPDFWRSSSAGAGAGAPTDIETSGIVQPPVHALAAWLVHRADPETSRRRGFLRRLYPRLAAWHRYLTNHRDLGGGGLVSAVHPWEPGMDNSPCWDGPLARIEPVAPDTFRRADLDHGAAEDRPTDLDYGRYVRLATGYRDAGYLDADAPHPFAVEDPGVNALLIASEYALAAIAAEAGPVAAAEAGGHRERAGRLTAALVERLWDAEAGQFLCRDLRADGGPAGEPAGIPDGKPDGKPAGELVRERSAAGLLPLVVPGLPDDVVRALLRTAGGRHFGLDSADVRLVPSYDLHGPAFSAHRYWRGPAWFNVNWLLERGLRQYGQAARADSLRAAMLSAADASGLAEYVDPHTGQGRGARDFSWTAALALDLLAGSGGAGRDQSESRGRADDRDQGAGRGQGGAEARGRGTDRSPAPDRVREPVVR